ncbi:hypothetical protein [Nonomuraea indica]|uniref:hypothetical protein n=1 Tax=Nonomuraea indica TaxID=1581193 RepID=UPI001183C46A|nr:hypothetical protein [Nonomuraea indica]
MAQPSKADICIALTRTDAHIIISPNTGYMLLAVRHCPHCDATHAHAADDHPYRTAPCTGRPYLLNIKEPTP